MTSYTSGGEHTDDLPLGNSFTRTIRNPAGDKVLFSYRASVIRLPVKDYIAEIEITPHERVSA